MKNKNGITLIALVITIIVLLILAGVSIQIVIGENGTANHAMKTVKQHDLESEREALGLAVVSWQGKKDDSSRLGDNLVDRNLANSSRWDIMVQDSTTYGSGWNYVKKGTDLGDYGKADYDWLINYDTGEVKLVEGKYNHFTYLSTIAVTDDLVANLDSANIFLNDLSSIGKNATLYYYEPDNSNKTDEQKYKALYDKQVKDYKNVDAKNEGYDRKISTDLNQFMDLATNAFKFNGNNYIEIHDANGFDFKKGLTYEFYGKLTGFEYLKLQGYDGDDFENFCGLFGLWSGIYDSQPKTRFGYNYKSPSKNNKSCLWYSLIATSNDLQGFNAKKDYGSWNLNDTYPWNQVLLFDMPKDEVFFTITIDPTGNDDVKQIIYVDGVEKAKGTLTRKYYNKFLELVKTLKYLELGRCSAGYAGNWSYQKGLSYTTRLYKKALTKDDVKANMDVTKAFHEYLIEENARNGVT